MRRQKRLTRKQRHNQAFEAEQARQMEEALAFNLVPFDIETRPLSGRMSSSQPNMQYIPRTADFHAELKDLLFELKCAERGQPVPQRRGGLGTVYIVDDPLARIDYAELEKHVLARMLDEATPNKALLLSSYGEALPEEHTELFKKMVEDALEAEKETLRARVAAKVALFASTYSSAACSAPLRLCGGKINGIGPARGLGSTQRK